MHVIEIFLSLWSRLPQRVMVTDIVQFLNTSASNQLRSLKLER